MKKVYICLISFILIVISIIPAAAIEKSCFDYIVDSIEHINSTAKDIHKEVQEKEEEKVKEKVELVPYSNSIPIYMTPEEINIIKNEVAQLEYEITLLSQTIYNEARGLNATHRAAIVWCVLNRVDAPGYGDTIYKVITAPNQFALWNGTPVLEEHTWVARDVVTRWIIEKHGYTNVGRVLPASYKFYAGDGKVNWFREEYNSRTYWNWAWGSPYL